VHAPHAKRNAAPDVDAVGGLRRLIHCVRVVVGIGMGAAVVVRVRVRVVATVTVAVGVVERWDAARSRVSSI
jgi:hypothetical protein